MPVYNGGRFLQQALDSLLAQDYGNLELIISDNGSVDGTQAICEVQAATDRRVRYFRSEVNCGPVANFARVLTMARGEYFMWAACDDLWEPTFVRTCVGSLEESPRVSLAFSGVNNIDGNGLPLKEYPRIHDLPSRDNLQRLRNYMLQEEHLGKANLVYGVMRRSAVTAAGGYRRWGAGVWGTDMLTVFGVLVQGDLAIVRETLFHKRLVQSSSELAPVQSGSIARRLRRVAASTTLWHGYFLGYSRIISTIGCLRRIEKLRLRAALCKRASRVYVNEAKQGLVHPFLRWAKRMSQGPGGNE